MLLLCGKSDTVFCGLLVVHTSTDSTGSSQFAGVTYKKLPADEISYDGIRALPE